MDDVRSDFIVGVDFDTGRGYVRADYAGKLLDRIARLQKQLEECRRRECRGLIALAALALILLASLPAFVR